MKNRPAPNRILTCNLFVMRLLFSAPVLQPLPCNFDENRTHDWVFKVVDKAKVRSRWKSTSFESETFLPEKAESWNQRKTFPYFSEIFHRLWKRGERHTHFSESILFVQLQVTCKELLNRLVSFWFIDFSSKSIAIEQLATAPQVDSWQLLQGVFSCLAMWHWHTGSMHVI